MSGDLQLPVDFERTHEFRLLVNALKGKAAGKEVSEKTIEASAVFLYLRLFVELAFLARSTNRPGYLTKSGRQLFEASLDPMFGAECSPTDMLREALMLEIPQSTVGEEGELYCPIFAQRNQHFAGNFITKEKKGQLSSLFERQKHRVAQEASQQAFLLPPETFRKRDTGEMMTSPEINRAMVLIKTLDNSLGAPSRPTQQYTESLIADAFVVSSKYAREPELLKDVYVWLANNRTHPAVPKTTEQVLRDFENIERMARR